MSHFFFLSPVWIHKLLKLVNEEKLKPVIPQATKQGSKRKRDEQDQQEEIEEEEEKEDEVAPMDPHIVALRKFDEEAEKEQHDEDEDSDDNDNDEEDEEEEEKGLKRRRKAVSEESKSFSR